MNVIAQIGGASFSIMQWVILLIVVISVVGILYVVAQANGVAIPAWVVKIFWIVAVAVVAIFAIKILIGMT
jgi:hypothetical protein